MTEDFEWTTEDDLSEEAWQSDVHSPVVRKKWGRWHWGISGAIIFIAVVTLVAYSQLERQAAAVSNQLRDDVLAVHQLVLETAVSRDTDLFQTFLSQPTSPWGSSQIELIARDLYFNRAPLGLWLDTSLPITNSLTITNATTTFSPEFQQVTVQVEQPYLTRNEEGEFEPVVLVNTAVYHQQNGFWQLTAPNNAFWGETQQTELGILTAHYPTHDAEIAESVTNDLNALIQDACEQNLFPCTQNLAVDLHFVPDIETMLGFDRNFELASRYSPNYGRRYSLTLPTPTLVGLPAGDAGYDALYRGYATQMLAALITNLHPNYFSEYPDRNLLTTQLAKMQFAVPELAGFHPLETAVPPPIPFPEQDILMFCRSESRGLNHFDLQSNAWTTIHTDDFIFNVSGLENDHGALLSVNGTKGNQILWWTPESRRFLTQEDQQAGFVLNRTFLMPDEANSHILNISGSLLSNSGYFKFDESNCSDDGCNLTEIGEWAVPSKNGRFNLINSVNDHSWLSKISLEDKTTGERTSYGLGFSLTWLGEWTFAFVRADEFDANDMPTQTTLVVVDVLEKNVVEYGLEDVGNSQEFENSGNVGDQFIIGGLIKSVDDFWMLLIYSVGPANFSLAYLMEFAPITDTFNPAFHFYDKHFFLDYETVVFLGSSPNNRYFLVAANEQFNVVMRLYDVEQNVYASYSVRSAWRGGYDWTLDGNWLLILEEDGVRLVAPDHDYEHFIVHDFGECETAVWVNP